MNIAATQAERQKGAMIFLQKGVEEKTDELQARGEAIKELTRAVEKERTNLKSSSDVDELEGGPDQAVQKSSKSELSDANGNFVCNTSH